MKRFFEGLRNVLFGFEMPHDTPSNLDMLNSYGIKTFFRTFCRHDKKLKISEMKTRSTEKSLFVALSRTFKSNQNKKLRPIFAPYFP